MLHRFALDTADGPRCYVVHQPTGVGVALPAPAVLMLHGAGGTAAWTLGETGLADTADREGFLLVLPEGMRPDPSRPPGFLHNAQTWNDGAPYSLPDQPKPDDVAFVAAVLDDVGRRFAVDPRRLYLTGFSNGAGMAFRLGADLSGHFAALAPVAGHCWSDRPRLEYAPSTLYIVGDQDPLVPLGGGETISPWGGVAVAKPPVVRTLRRWAEALGCPPEPVEMREQDGIRTSVYGRGRGGAEFTAHVVAGLGHHWPGGRGQLSRRLAGPPSDRLRANDFVWDFFRRHSLPRSEAGGNNLCRPDAEE
jgi:polyhydroxybutyrate depolymerase